MIPTYLMPVWIEHTDNKSTYNNNSQTHNDCNTDKDKISLIVTVVEIHNLLDVTLPDIIHIVDYSCGCIRGCVEIEGGYAQAMQKMLHHWMQPNIQVQQ